MVSGARTDADRQEARERAKEGERRGCLVCRKGDGGFTSPEHIFPESLGNSDPDLILPNGIVCDRCNHGVLARLDKTLCEFPPIMMRRTMLSIPAKSGKVPTTKVAEGQIVNLGPGAIGLNPSNDTVPMIREVGRSEEGIHLRVDWSGRLMTNRYGSELSRAILKVALECAWLDHGVEVLGQPFDHVRAAVLGEPRDGYVALGKKGDPEHFASTVSYHILPAENDEVRIYAGLKVFGVSMITDSRQVDAPPGFHPPECDVIPFTEAHFRRR